MATKQKDIAIEVPEVIEDKDKINTENTVIFKSKKYAWHTFSNVVVMRSIIGLLYLLIFLCIILSLIVNPKSLNLEDNPVIAMMIGALITYNKEVIAYFFPNNGRES